MKKKRVIRTVNGSDLDRCDLDLWCRRGLAQRSCLDLLWRAQRAILFFSAARPRPAILFGSLVRRGLAQRSVINM